MENITKVTLKLRSSSSLVRLRSGFLIKDILERTAKKIDGTLKPNRSMFIYSGHSSTIGTILNGFGLNEVVYFYMMQVNLSANNDRQEHLERILKMWFFYFGS